MKRVEVVAEREEMNSTRFDGVREWGSAGCLGKGEASGSMLGGGKKKTGAATNRTDQRLDWITSDPVEASLGSALLPVHPSYYVQSSSLSYKGGTSPFHLLDSHPLQCRLHYHRHLTLNLYHQHPAAPRSH